MICHFRLVTYSSKRKICSIYKIVEMYLGIYASSPGYFGQYQITYMQLHDYGITLLSLPNIR